MGTHLILHKHIKTSLNSDMLHQNKNKLIFVHINCNCRQKAKAAISRKIWYDTIGQQALSCLKDKMLEKHTLCVFTLFGSVFVSVTFWSIFTWSTSVGWDRFTRQNKQEADEKFPCRHAARSVTLILKSSFQTIHKSCVPCMLCLITPTFPSYFWLNALRWAQVLANNTIG